MSHPVFGELHRRLFLVVFTLCVGVQTLTAQETNTRPIAPPTDLIFQYPTPRTNTGPGARLLQVTSLLNVSQARTNYSVDGTGLTAAIIDTGLRVTHQDFTGKVVAQRNFTSDNGGDTNNAADGQGHGTNVAGIVCANGIHTGMAPGAKVIPLKVLTNSGGGSFSAVVSALDWVIANRTTYNITVVNMSLGDGRNYTSDSGFSSDTVRQRIATLRSNRVAVCVAAGNDYYENNSREGMSYPAICRESVSVGATFDANLGRVSYGGPIANTTAAGRITPFSQRLHPTTNSVAYTDIFAPGAALTSSGIQSDQGESTAHGTSQATPVTAGLILLAQQYWLRQKGSLPTVDQLEKWLRASKYTNIDGDDEDDNVGHSQKSYINIDAVELMTAVKAEADTSTPPPTTSTSNVAVSYNSSTKLLSITGDAGSNNFTVTYQSGRVTVQGGTETTINRNTTAFTATVATTINVSINSGNGNDTVAITGAPVGTMNVQLGSGNDTLRLSYCNITTLNLNGGTGTDAYTLISSQVTNRSVTAVP